MKQLWLLILLSSSGVVVKLLACGAWGPGFDSPDLSSAMISEISDLLLQSRDMAEILLKAT